MIHIRRLCTQANTSLYFYSQINPPLGLLSRIPQLNPSASAVRKSIANSVPQDVAEISHIDFRPDEGGAFVRFRAHDEQKLEKLVKKGFTSRWLLFTSHATGFKVIGKPWITDIPHKLSRTVSVEPGMRKEDLYDLLRQYGKLSYCRDNIAKFASLSSACAALACAHRSVYAGQELRLHVVPQRKILKTLGAWFFEHPRITLPALIALLFAVAYAVFEPVRQWGVENKVKGTFQHYVDKLSFGLIASFSKTGKPLDVISEAKNDNVQELERELSEGQSTFIVVSGPKGSGKTDVIAATLSGCEQPVLLIDCNSLRGPPPNVVVKSLARMVGYWPIFTWTNSISRAAEIGIQGVTGQKTELTRSFDEQVEGVLDTVAHALKNLATAPLGKNKTTNQERDFLSSHPEARPVVVIQGFLSNDSLSQVLSKWCASLLVDDVAKVIISTSDMTVEKTLASILPNRVLRTVHISDANPAVAKQYIYDNFMPYVETDMARQSFQQLRDMDGTFLKPLGGRMQDLQAFGRRLLAGEKPVEALDALVKSASVEVSQLFLSSSKQWTIEQAWILINQLARTPVALSSKNSKNSKNSEKENDATAETWLSVPGQILGTFGFMTLTETQKTLEAVEEAELVQTRSVGGRIVGIRPVSPLYMEAFKRIVSDPLFAPLMNQKVAQARKAVETAKIQDIEKEMQGFTVLAPHFPPQLKQRVAYLCSLMNTSQAVVELCDQEIAECREQLQKFGWYAQNEPSSGFA